MTCPFHAPYAAPNRLRSAWAQRGLCEPDYRQAL